MSGTQNGPRKFLIMKGGKMPIQKQTKPTEAELEILQILWYHGPTTVRVVNGMLNQKKEVGYTTTLKIMQIMVEKKLVTRDTSSRSHVYKTAVAEEDTLELLLNRFVDTAFQGSAMKLVMQALGNRPATRAELAEVRKFLDQIEGEENVGD